MDTLTHRMDVQPILSVTINTMLSFDGHGEVTCKQTSILYLIFQARLDKNNLENMIKKAMQTSAKFNAELNRERKEERRAYFDLQTNVSNIGLLSHCFSSPKRRICRDAEGEKSEIF